MSWPPGPDGCCGSRRRTVTGYSCSGAWGCGVFGNDPAVIPTAFAGQIARSGGWFDRIVFPVYDRQAGTPTHATFTRVLAQDQGIS